MRSPRGRHTRTSVDGQLQTVVQTECGEREACYRAERPVGARTVAPPGAPIVLGPRRRASVSGFRDAAPGPMASLRRHAAEADEAAGELDLAHVAQAVLVDPALGGVEQGDALGSGDAGAVGGRDLRRERAV